MVLAVERAFEVAYGFPFLVGKVHIRAQGHRFIRVTVAAVDRVAERFELGYGGYDVFPAGFAVSRLSVVVGVSSGNRYFRGGNFFAVAVKVFIADFALLVRYRAVNVFRSGYGGRFNRLVCGGDNEVACGQLVARFVEVFTAKRTVDVRDVAVGRAARGSCGYGFGLVCGGVNIYPFGLFLDRKSVV